MQLARVSPSQSIVVENAPLGVEAGNKAGAFTVGVVTGPIPVEEMERAGAAVVFPSSGAFAEAFAYYLYFLSFLHRLILSNACWTSSKLIMLCKRFSTPTIYPLL